MAWKAVSFISFVTTVYLGRADSNLEKSICGDFYLKLGDYFNFQCRTKYLIIMLQFHE